MNRQDNNFGDITTNHIEGALPDEDGLRECPHDQMDCPHYKHDKCGVDECVYEKMKEG